MNAGERLGSYEVLAPIGKGGMGEVYRARDTKLGRDVALKILPAAFASDPDRMARFEREARVLASLDHPNIAAIYGLEESNDVRALVLALVDGPTLADRIAAGPIPLEEAIQIARQIAEAVEYAHDRGVIHRDLKPANIKITSGGMVKVLDFGLAKALDDEPVAGSGTNSPTLTMNATRAGVLLGTAAYMSPEQAKGKQADRRSDIWSFGAVLYEMLTGKPPFSGETVGDILASVIKDEPKLDALPSELRVLVARCLNKDPRQRLQAIGEARIALQNPTTGTETKSAVTKRSRPWAWMIATSVFMIALGFVLYRHAREEEPRVLKMSVLPPEKAAFKGTSLPALSPDGKRLAFVATSGGKDVLWVRDLDSLAARAVIGTEGADDPFWSPNSRKIAFFADNKLKTIEAAGGPVLTISDVAGAARGGSWSQNNVIVFGTNNGGTFRVPAAGGSVTLITTPDRISGETSHRYPCFLPDGRHFLYTANNSEPEKIAIYVSDVESKGRKLIIATRSNATYAPPGTLLYVREGTLMAQPFDARKLETTGDAIPIAEQVDPAPGVISQNLFSVSRNGLLAYLSGGLGRGWQLTWFDRSGRATGTLGEPGLVNYWSAISPDGRTVAVSRGERSLTVNIWLYDLVRGTVSRFTFGPRSNNFPVWSPDGSRIAFYSTRDGTGHAFQKVVLGIAQEEVLDKPLGDPPRNTFVSDWSRDGRYIIEDLNNNSGKTKGDIWVLPLFGDRKPFPYLQTEFDEWYAKLSPNGQWLAYTSDESKRYEIYVQTFPTPGGKWQISTNGGSRPIWSRDGTELYFISADSKLMAVEVKGSGAKFEAGVPKPLFDVRFPGGTAWFDITKDGRFLIPVPVEESAAAPITVVVNWQARLGK